ncbi:dTDP-glucose 4,6-dehydratase [Halobacteriovorax sp. RT-2-4]|uniref:dTDP-glucose 4,6-dehydratase n=1 Tax=unclassified Halobacteriovorax TaxID=2639665 RepID=UPI00399A07C8
MSKNILISGGSGFIGSNFINYFIDKYKDYQIINVDKLTYAANEDNNQALSNRDNYHFVQADICDTQKIYSIIEKYNITDIIHFAAESHVDNSINGPESFIKTNINGTFNLLDASYKYWLKNKQLDTSRFHHISTDEVYGSLEKDGYFTESSQYAPNSPYASSKAASDMLVRSYHKTFGLNTVTTNCSNNYGPYQHREKLIPKIVSNALEMKPIPIYGSGQNVRDWLHVIDHCRAIDTVFHNAKNGEKYNIGGNTEISNIEIAKLICNIINELLPERENDHNLLITFVEDRLGHDFRYAIDSTKIKNNLNWSPSIDFETGIKETVKHFLNLNNS